MFLSIFERVELDKILAAIAAAEVGPTESELSVAPILDEWLPLTRAKVVILTGVVTGHPILGTDGIFTSPLIRINLDEMWARTESRWYRLGSPLNGQPGHYDMDGFQPLHESASLDEILSAYIRDVHEIERRARS